jgi:hemolysin D
MRLIIEALQAFSAKYLTVFKAAWQVREQLDPPPRTQDELAFLPAHLELVETPVNPLPKYTVRIIIVIFLVALLWACIGKLDIVAVATGKTVSSGRTKIIQPLESGVVTAIHVKDGQYVKAGQALVELDAIGTHADASKADSAFSSAQGSYARYEALLIALNTDRAPIPFRFDGSKEEIETENRLAQSEYQAFAAKRNAAKGQLTQRQAELATTQTLIRSLQASTLLAQARSKDMKDLVEKKYIARHDYLTVEQQRIDAEQNLETQRSRVFELQAAIAAQRNELDSMVAEFRRQTTDGLRQSSEQSRQLGADVNKAKRRDQLMRLVAPVDGTVQQLAIHTVGGVVTPAQPLMAIVPEGESLEVEAQVLNKDIGFVKAGQTATIKIESFPTGTVESVSHDAMQDEKLGLIYQARVKLKRSDLNIEGTKVNLSSGMALSVEINTGKRKVISYLLSPLQQHADESLRER